MEVILLPKSQNAHRGIHCGSIAVSSWLVVMLVVVGLAAYGGYRAGLVGEPAAPVLPDSDWQQVMAVEQEKVDEAIRSSKDNLNALAKRLGRLQAQIIRLEALGKRLVETADLDAEEFGFGRPPAVGGPSAAAILEPQTVPDFLADLDALSAALENLGPQFKALGSALVDRRLEAQIHPAGRPVRRGWISSYYGRRTDPLTGRRDIHEGMDFAGKRGSDVLAVAAGVVSFAGRRQGFGHLVAINHGNGYLTRYAHNQKLLVKVGDVVKKGQRIALMGSSGRSTGPHVHFEVRYNGKPVNPLKYVQGKG